MLTNFITKLPRVSHTFPFSTKMFTSCPCNSSTLNCYYDSDSKNMDPNCTRAQISENGMYAPVAFSRRKNLIYPGLKIRLGAGEKNCLKRVVLFVLMVRPSGIFCMFDTNTGIPFTPENCIFLVWRIFVTLGIVKREFHALLTCKNGSKNACSPGSAKKGQLCYIRQYCIPSCS